eukprot:6203828-Pleurochrysis_carterae.AAC.5
MDSASVLALHRHSNRRAARRSRLRKDGRLEVVKDEGEDKEVVNLQRIEKWFGATKQVSMEQRSVLVTMDCLGKAGKGGETKVQSTWLQHSLPSEFKVANEVSIGCTMISTQSADMLTESDSSRMYAANQAVASSGPLRGKRRSHDEHQHYVSLKYRKRLDRI